MPHFMKPHYFEPEQQAALAETLAGLELGDDEGRRIFILALEYELAEYEKSSEEVGESPTQAVGDQGLEAVARSADELVGQLDSLSRGSARQLGTALRENDRFQRDYGGDYLRALRDEVARLSSACSGDFQAEHAPAARLGEAERRLLKMMAEAFSECFEEEPTAATGSSFIQLLEKIAEIFDLSIAVEVEQLTAVLAEWRSA